MRLRSVTSVATTSSARRPSKVRVWEVISTSSTRPFFGAVAPEAGLAQALGDLENVLHQTGDVLGRADVLDRQREELLPAVAVFADRRPVDGQDAKAFHVVDEHRVGVVQEEEPVALLVRLELVELPRERRDPALGGLEPGCGRLCGGRVFCRHKCSRMARVFLVQGLFFIILSRNGPIMNQKETAEFQHDLGRGAVKK